MTSFRGLNIKLDLTPNARVLLSSKYSAYQPSETTDVEALYTRIEAGDISTDEGEYFDTYAESDTGDDAADRPLMCLPTSAAAPEDRLHDLGLVADLSVLVQEAMLKEKSTWGDIYRKEGARGLPVEVMSEEVKQRIKERKAFYDKGLEWATFIMEQVLLSTERILLESLIFGNLALDRRNNGKLEDILVRLEKQSACQPGIRYQSLVDGEGHSTSVNQLLKLCDKMMGYIKGCREPEITDIVAGVNDMTDNRIDNIRNSMQDKISAFQSMAGYRM